MQKGKAKPFYGWVIVGAAFAVAVASVGIFNNTLGVFVVPVTESLGFSRGSFTLYNTVRSICGMIALPVFGELYRRGNIRRIMLVCTLCVAVAPLGYSVSSKLWHFYAFAALQGLATNGINTVAVATLVNNWFHEKKGVATGIALSGSGLGGAIMVPVIARVVELQGWRWGYRLMSVTGVAILLPTILLLVRGRPADMGLVPLGFTPRAQGEDAATDDPALGFTRAEVLRMPAFYLVVTGFFLACFTGGGMQVHTMAYLTDIGHSSSFASLIVSICMFTLIFGKIVLGAVYDRFGMLAGGLSVCVAVILSGFLLLSAQRAAFAYMFAVVIGYSVAYGTVSSSLLTSRYFGSRDFSRVYSVVSLAGGLSNAICQPFPGYVYDFTGSYVPAWYLSIGGAVAAIVVLIAADRLMRAAWNKRIAEGAKAAVLS